MSNFLIAQIFGVFGIVFSVLSMQMKTKKKIMIMLFCLNLASALNFLFLDSLSGSYICFFAMIETVINYFYDTKNKKVPLLIVILYIIINIALGLLGYNTILDLIPIACALLYCATVCTKRESNIRKLMLGNQTLWLVYDIVNKAYMFSISNILTIISTGIAIYRFDCKNKKKA